MERPPLGSAVIGTDQTEEGTLEAAWGEWVEEEEGERGKEDKTAGGIVPLPAI